jgi:hypothetical protein
MKKGNSIAYKISAIKTIKYVISDKQDDEVSLLLKEEEKLRIRISVDINVRQELSQIQIDIKSVLFHTDDSEDILVQHIGRTGYSIKEIDKLHNNGELKIPIEIKKLFLRIAFPHTRALLAVENSPTVYKDEYFLPVVDISDYMDENGAFKDS